MFGEDIKVLSTIEKDGMKDAAQINASSERDEALKEIYKKLRPGEPPLVESALTLVSNLFFDPKRYDLAPVGRYKFNKKMGIASRIAGRKLLSERGFCHHRRGHSRKRYGAER